MGSLRERISEDLQRPLQETISPPIPALLCEPGRLKLAVVDTEYAPDETVLDVAVATPTESYSEARGSGFPQVSHYLDQAEWLGGYSVAGDVVKLVQAGITLKDKWVRGDNTLDALLLARLHNENDVSYKIEDQLKNWATFEGWKKDTIEYSETDATQWPTDLRSVRCANDAWAAAYLLKKLWMAGRPSPKLILFTHRVASVLERVRIAGAVIDQGRFNKLDADLSGKLVQLRDQLTKIGAMQGIEGFSPTNDSHIRELLFKRLGLPVARRTGTGLPSVDRTVLQGLPGDVARTLVEFNKADKLWGVNIEGLREFLRPIRGLDAEAAWLEVNINPLGARTGRRASSRPNMQNWTKKSGIRGLIRSRFKDGMIGAFDYKKLEPRIFGWTAKDDKLLAYFTTGGGYIDVARDLMRTEIDEKSDIYRAVKAVVLGVHYNLQTPHMAKNLWTMYPNPVRFSVDYEDHVEETDRIRALYLRSFPGVARYIAKQQAFWEAHHCAVGFTGQVRHLPSELQNDWHSANQAINFPIQNLAGDVTGSAMLDVEARLMQEQGFTSYTEYLEALLEDRKFLLTNSTRRGTIRAVIWNEVHDEVSLDFAPEVAKRYTELVVEEMRAVPTLRGMWPEFDCPLDVDPIVASHWHGD